MTNHEKAFVKAAIDLIGDYTTSGQPDDCISICNAIEVVVCDYSDHPERRDRNVFLVRKAKAEYESGSPEDGETLIGMIAI